MVLGDVLVPQPWGEVFYYLEAGQDGMHLGDAVGQNKSTS